MALVVPELKTMYEIRNAFVLVIVNEKFQYFERRCGADADRRNIYTLCKNAHFTLNETRGLKTDDLTAEEMEDLFETISKGNFSPYDAFICFISSYGDSGGILGVDCDNITVKEIVRHLSKRCSTLVGKPKLFFIQSCRPRMKDEVGDKVVAEHAAYSTSSSITVPIETDILVAYSSLDGYESYRNLKEEGSWFITVLTQVLSKYAHYMSLTDMLAKVNEIVTSMEHCGKRQMPLFMSTLRKAVNLKMSKPSESKELPACNL
ncbi:caspase-3-like [Paramuricea clavata]|uniref:Caspase-3-like n=1 Tax=Paramuricea clavata TaxID=317549 RepID=A0A7D9LT33_PARCT|nr:caspase-3-like [Paramuricea clavata]